ncbi:calcium-binding protein [Nocardia sp. XZ_19_231]|uniref:calcium-binding protein n=1 Tax=Nocardia sp. XZ_19_231 TaxID=2769252 RepID=UPI001E374242|nr:calcium-binding protein [Nocardia sp. XZ_19_231]
MNLQEAQNTIQAAGVFFSRSTDASGRGRAQVMDRNWTVVAQEPAPGTLIGVPGHEKVPTGGHV